MYGLTILKVAKILQVADVVNEWALAAAAKGASLLML
jgi:hypothetical protein